MASPTVVGTSRGSLSAELRLKITLASGDLSAEPGRTIWQHPRLAHLYPDFLFATHCIIRASVPLMRAGVTAVRQQPSSAISARLIAYLEHHIEEEAGHDEWLLDDMAALGLSREQVLERVPPAQIMQVVGTQYYLIEHVDPAALLGYILVLEGRPPRRSEIEAAITRTGLPQRAFHTFLKHADADPVHGAELERLIDSLPFTPRQQDVIGANVLSAILGFHAAFAGLFGVVRE